MLTWHLTTSDLRELANLIESSGEVTINIPAPLDNVRPEQITFTRIIGGGFIASRPAILVIHPNDYETIPVSPDTPLLLV